MHLKPGQGDRDLNSGSKQDREKITILSVIKEEFTLKKIMLLSILLASIGVYLIVYSYLDDPHKIIARALKGGEIALPYPNRINTIYFIRNIDTGCTSCVRYLAYKAFPAVNITFMVEKDFSDIDIKNFRETFNIAEQDKIERVTAPWRTVFQKCTRKDQNPSNLLVVINEKEEPIYYRRF